MEFYLTALIVLSATSTGGLPLELLIPVVVALCSVIVYLYRERKKDHTKMSALEEEFRKKIQASDKRALDTIVKNAESYRKELTSVIKAAYTNNTKIAEILTAINLKSDRMLAEIAKAFSAHNNLYLRPYEEDEDAD